MKRARPDTDVEAKSASAAASPPRAAAARSFYGAPAGGGAASAAPHGLALPPLHDPCAPGALVLSVAGDVRYAWANGVNRVPSWPPCVADPHVAARLKPHQREGVRFAFAALSGAAEVEAEVEEDGAAAAPGPAPAATPAPQPQPPRGARGPPFGCVLADDVGLGKTLTALCAVHALLRQSPIAGPTAAGHRGLARRALVLCPASVVDTWAAEAGRWFGASRLGCCVLRAGGGPTEGARGAARWADASNTRTPLLVLSYETLRGCAASLAPARAGLMVCDEAHRLASEPAATLAAMRAAAPSARRLLLTASPVQNSVADVWALCDAARPGALGPRAGFARDVEAPLEAARRRDATHAQRAAGAAAEAALGERLGGLLLRRSRADAAPLPPCAALALFCAPTGAQARALAAARGALAAGGGAAGGAGGAGVPLAALALLQRLCTSPACALDPPQPARRAGAGGGDGGGDGAGAGGDADDGPPGLALAAAVRCALRPADACDPSGAKLLVLAALLAAFRDAGERCVVAAGSVAALDAAAAVAASLGLRCARLDGATGHADRARAVAALNAGVAGGGGRLGGLGFGLGFGAAAQPQPPHVLLLSRRAGGVGLSLVGASRLVLFDSDWNPAADAQTIGRLHRPGQARPVVVYRLLLRCSVDETIYQRGLSKHELAAAADAAAAQAPRPAVEGGGGGGAAAALAAAAAQRGRTARVGAFTAAELRLVLGGGGDDGEGGEGGEGGGGAGCATARLLRWSDDRAAPAAADDAPLAAALATGVVSFVRIAPAEGGGAAEGGGL